MVARAFFGSGCRARAVVARAFLVAVVVGLEQWLSRVFFGGSGCRARAVVARAFLVAVVVGLEQWLLEHSWWQWL